MSFLDKAWEDVGGRERLGMVGRAEGWPEACWREGKRG